MKFILYPEYFDPRLSRKGGRRIKKINRKTFSSPELQEVLKFLNVRYIERKARYSRIPWQESSIFEIDSEVRKGTLMKMIERKIGQP